MRNVLRIPSQSSSACWTGGAGASSRSRGNGVPGSGFSHGFWLILTSFPCVLIFLMTSEFLRLPLCAILLCLPLFCRAGGEPSPAAALTDVGPPEVNWTSLRYAANRFGVSLSTTLELDPSSREDMLVPPYSAFRNEPFQIVPDVVMRLDIHAHAETMLDSYNTEGRVWFAPGGLGVLQRDRLKPGPGGSRKIYRFAGDGAFRIRLEPNGRNEGRQSPANWTKIKQNFYPYDLLAAGCDRVTTPVLLLYRASSRDPVNGGKPLCAFVDDALYRVWLESRGEVPRPVDYAVKSGGTMHEFSGNRRTLKLSLRVVPITPGADPAAFELLELRGAIAIYIDADTRLPVLITGERAGAGELDVGLVEAALHE
jgi:hypothetical protein